MNTTIIQRITTGFGLVYLLIGILGFLPGITVPTHHGPVPGEGLLLGIFAVNVVHNLAHLLLGAVLLWGGLSAARVTSVNRVMAGVFALLVVASIIAPLAEGVAINPPDTVLHLASTVLTAVLGFATSRQPAPSRS